MFFFGAREGRIAARGPVDDLRTRRFGPIRVFPNLAKDTAELAPDNHPMAHQLVKRTCEPPRGGRGTVPPAQCLAFIT